MLRKSTYRIHGFSFIECLLVMMLASLIMILTVELQLVFFKQWRHQETLIDWQENQRLGYLLFKAWLHRLQVQYEDDFVLMVLLPEALQPTLTGHWRSVLQQAKPGNSLLLAWSAGEIESIWYISKSSGLFYKGKEESANELLTDVESWQVSLQQAKENTEAHLLSVSMQWVKPLNRWDSMPFYYAYTSEQSDVEEIGDEDVS